MPSHNECCMGTLCELSHCSIQYSGTNPERNLESGLFGQLACSGNRWSGVKRVTGQLNPG